MSNLVAGEVCSCCSEEPAEEELGGRCRQLEAEGIQHTALHHQNLHRCPSRSGSVLSVQQILLLGLQHCNSLQPGGINEDVV